MNNNTLTRFDELIKQMENIADELAALNKELSSEFAEVKSLIEKDAGCKFDKLEQMIKDKEVWEK